MGCHERSGAGINAGILDIGGNEITLGKMEVNGGSVIDSAGGGSISTLYLDTTSGTISASLAGEVSIWQKGAGTTVLSGVKTFTRGVVITAGQITTTIAQGLGTGLVLLEGGT